MDEVTEYGRQALTTVIFPRIYDLVFPLYVAFHSSTEKAVAPVLAKKAFLYTSMVSDSVRLRDPTTPVTVFRVSPFLKCRTFRN